MYHGRETVLGGVTVTDRADHAPERVIWTYGYTIAGEKKHGCAMSAVGVAPRTH
jgi:hypothetical protein